MVGLSLGIFGKLHLVCTAPMILPYQYRLLPSERQYRVLEAILEAQRELNNAALQERIGAYEKKGSTISYFDQTKSLTLNRAAVGPGLRNVAAVRASVQAESSVDPGANHQPLRGNRGTTTL
ncbi:MAG TPA: hypothetical protein VN878_07305 [Usitatibacter sp.]|nr:hypothetical protein [Usitatibacter sp.]